MTYLVRRLLGVSVVFLGTARGAWAQSPDISLGVDLGPTLLSERGGNTRFRWYDGMGRPSLVTLRLDLETGWRLVVSERLQGVRGESDSSLLHEAYLEDPGTWRVGKQLMPFGRDLLKENVMAARINTRLVVDQLPISIAVADAGKRRQRGVTARIGSRLGVSLALGNHWTLASGSLSPVRLPEQSPGAGRGFQQVYGIDYIDIRGPWQLIGEAIWLREPESTLDREEWVSDLRTVYRDPERRFRVTFGWARSWRIREDHYRIEGEWAVAPQVSLVPILKFVRGSWQGLSLTTRIRL